MSLIHCRATDAKSTWLVFNGLDTFTTIKFCDQFVGTTNNQFRQWTFDVSPLLKSCTQSPVLSIEFGSAPNIVDAIANDPQSERESFLSLLGRAYADNWVDWPSGIQLTYEFPNRWFMRKEQSDFGWDWGPAFAPAGPWLPAYLVQFEREESVYITNTDLDIYRQGQVSYLPPDQSQPWVVNASLDFLGNLPSRPSMSIEIHDARTGEGLVSKPLEHVTMSGQSITGTVILTNDSGNLAPKIWWPNGMGEQNLYNVTITVTDESGKTTYASITKRTGFRTIFLNQLNITDEQIAMGIAPGANWHFEVNGHEFYAKGSNFIPPDAFWPRVTETKMRRLFDAIVNGRQNMLRVWASGAYLPDFIYDLADEYGVLLWSEFEFSDCLYPADDAFLANVAEEVKYQVRRVNHHPSLALWAGGNELESLEIPLAKNADPTGYSYFIGQYEKLFISLIYPLVWENSHSISYMPSSTNNGYLHIDRSQPVPIVERYWNTTPGSYYGDTDYYNYDSEVAFKFWSYPVGRFANEFGFHSMPSLQSWQQAIRNTSDLSFNSSVVMLRNHHYPAGNLSTDNFHNTALGMGEMTLAVQRYYPAPDKSDPVANFSAWCHATQLFQADMYKSEIQFYRRGSGMPERQLGSLYWQLEDIWQAPTWAGIEYDGRWKVLHYVAKDIYSNVIVSPFYDYETGDMEVYVTSDLWEPVSGTLNMTWLDLGTGRPLGNNAGTPLSASFTVGALNTTRIYKTNVNELQLADMTNSILLLDLEAKGHTPNSDPGSEPVTFTHQNHFTPVWPKDLKLVDPGLTLSYDPIANLASPSTSKTFTVEATKGVALYTWLDYPAGLVGYFEENAFVLRPGEKKEVKFVVQKMDENGNGNADWVSKVTVQSLWDQKVRT